MVIGLKIMLINPSMPVFGRVPSLPLGLISIASYLKHYGHEVKIVECLVENNSIEENLKSFEPDIVGISVLSYLSGIDAKRITASIQAAGFPVVWGGQAATAMPDLVLREAKPDYIILGEGEITWLELVETMQNGGDIREVDGLAYLENGKVVFTKTRAVADISQFPDINWDLINVEHYFSSFFGCDKMFYLHASKGCPAQCIFCSNQTFHQHRNRSRNPEQIMRDIDYLYAHGANGIYFSDELFLPKRDERTKLCEMLIERNYNLTWGCQMRLGVLNEDDVKLMYKAGCRWILFGIESGNPERIKSIKKNIDLSIAKETIGWCEKAGMTVQASFIIGFPEETEEEIRNTVSFAKSLGASIINVNILTPLPNSEIYAYANRVKNYYFPDSIKGCGIEVEQNATDKVIVNLSNVSDVDLKVVHYYFHWRSFVGKGTVKGDSFGIIKKLARDTFNRIFKHGVKGFIYGTYSSVKQFLTVYYYSHFHRKIKKKYGLK